jgi:hypothetical protein
MQEGKIAHASFPPRWDYVVRDELMLMQEGKLARASFPHDGMMLYEMRSCLGKRES